MILGSSKLRDLIDKNKWVNHSTLLLKGERIMFFIAYLPIFLYLLLEFYRSSPVKEEKQNSDSSFFYRSSFSLDDNYSRHYVFLYNK